MSAATTEPQNGAELLARIRPTLREESTYLCLRPDLLKAWEEAQEALAEQLAKDAAGSQQRVGQGASSKKARDLAAEVARLEAEIEETQVKFTLRAMRQDKWRSLCDSHAPRKGNELDLYSGYNRDAVLDAAVRECLIDPIFDDASWATFLEVCNPSEWAELRNVVTVVNRAVVDAPKSDLASRILAKPARASRPRAAGE